MKKQFLKYDGRFELELGGYLESPTIAYHTYGQLNEAKDNVVWVCHALTANSDPLSWWDQLFGEGKSFDPADYFIVCANILGSCYGSTGPRSTNPETGEPYYLDFPAITIRDMVKGHQELQRHLGIDKIKVAVGGSMGGYQIIEWAHVDQLLIENMVLICTGAKESAWGIGIHTTQRMAMETDSTFTQRHEKAGENGLKTARAIGILTYRNYDIFIDRQTDEDTEKTDNFKAISYLRYQGEKLATRFDAQTYWVLSKAMDTHNVGRGRGGVENVLKDIHARTLVIGITSDILCPVVEQQFLAKHLPYADYHEIDSKYGHDGFLIEGQQIGALIEKFCSKEIAS